MIKSLLGASFSVVLLLLFPFSVRAFEVELNNNPEVPSGRGGNDMLTIVASTESESTGAKVRFTLDNGVISAFNAVEDNGFLTIGTCDNGEAFMENEVCFDVAPATGSISSGDVLGEIIFYPSKGNSEVIVNVSEESGYILADGTSTQVPADLEVLTIYESNSNQDVVEPIIPEQEPVESEETGNALLYAGVFLGGVILLAVISYLVYEKIIRPKLANNSEGDINVEKSKFHVFGVIVLVVSVIGVISAVAYLSTLDTTAPEDSSAAVPLDHVTVCPNDAISCDYAGADGLQTAIAEIPNGGIISIMEGVYVPNNFIDYEYVNGLTSKLFLLIDKDISLNGVGRVVINNQSNIGNAIVINQNKNVQLYNFTIKNFNASDVNCHEKDYCTDGDGINAGAGSNVILKNMKIHNMRKDGVVSRGNMEIENSEIYNNGWSGIVAVDNTVLNVENSVIANNAHSPDTQQYELRFFPGIYAGDNSQVTIINSANLTLPETFSLTSYHNGVIEVDYSTVSLPVSAGTISLGTGVINSDPKFINAGSGNFRLKSGSPALNTGDPSILDVDRSRSDMGSYGGPNSAVPIAKITEYAPPGGDGHFKVVANDKSRDIKRIEVFISHVDEQNAWDGPIALQTDCGTNYECVLEFDKNLSEDYDPGLYYVAVNVEDFEGNRCTGNYKNDVPNGQVKVDRWGNPLADYFFDCAATYDPNGIAMPDGGGDYQVITVGPNVTATVTPIVTSTPIVTATPIITGTPVPNELDIAVCAPKDEHGVLREGFTTTIDNEFLPYVVGDVIHYEGEEEGVLKEVTIEVTSDTEEVAGIVTRVVKETELEDGELVEESWNYYVQAPDGSVCYYGERVNIYEGDVTVHDGEWRADEGDNQPGIMMPVNPEVGMRHYQEKAPEIALDYAEITEMGGTYTTQFNTTFRDVMSVRETTELEPGHESPKKYQRGVGLIMDSVLDIKTTVPTNSCQCDLWAVVEDQCNEENTATCTGKFDCQCMNTSILACDKKALNTDGVEIDNVEPGETFKYEIGFNKPVTERTRVIDLLPVGVEYVSNTGTCFVGAGATQVLGESTVRSTINSANSSDTNNSRMYISIGLFTTGTVLIAIALTINSKESNEEKIKIGSMRLTRNSAAGIATGVVMVTISVFMISANYYNQDSSPEDAAAADPERTVSCVLEAGMDSVEIVVRVKDNAQDGEIVNQAEFDEIDGGATGQNGTCHNSIYIGEVPVITPTTEPSLEPSVSPTPIGPVACGPIDENGDGDLGIDDFSAFASIYGTGNTPCNDSDQDFGECGGKDTNVDNKVGIADFGGRRGLSFASRYNRVDDSGNPTCLPFDVVETTPTITPTTTVTPELDIAVCAPKDENDVPREGFTTVIDNEFLPYPVGHIWRFEGDDEGVFKEVEIEVTSDTEVVAGIETRVVKETELEDNVLVEESWNYYVQAPDGSVCYYGERVNIYEEGATVHDGQWRADEDGNVPGIMMPVNPEVGMEHYQEKAPGVALDYAQITEMGGSYTTQLGVTFDDVMSVRETTELEPGHESPKKYQRGLGLIMDAAMDLKESLPPAP